MCGCERHQDQQAECTCICPEHRNFDAAYALAMSRYDEIQRLAAVEAEHDRLVAGIQRMAKEPARVRMPSELRALLDGEGK